MMTTKETFTCSDCGEEFERDEDFSMADAIREYEAFYHKKFKASEVRSVCPDCHKKAVVKNKADE